VQPEIKVTVTSGRAEKSLAASLKRLKGSQVLVGVPESTAQQRMLDIIELASKAGKKRKAYLLKVAQRKAINNAQLVYIQTNGSILKNIPARPIIEPAIKNKDNLALLTSELILAAEASLDGRPEDVTKHLKRTALLAEGLVRRWFTDPRNHWAPNAPETIRRKGSDRPNIDTAEMRKSIVGLVSEEQ
jgi:hypothetical protein